MSTAKNELPALTQPPGPREKLSKSPGIDPEGAAGYGRGVSGWASTVKGCVEDSGKAGAIALPSARSPFYGAESTTQCSL